MVFCLLSFSLYVIFRIIPIADTFRLSFYSWSILGVGNKFIGLGNYFKLFQDKLFITALVNTTLFAILVVFFSVVISLALAIMLNNKRMERFFSYLRIDLFSTGGNSYGAGGSNVEVDL